MRFKVVAAGLVGGIAFVAAVGCGPDSTAPPLATSTTGTTPTTPQSQISKPLDISKFTADICSGLTDAQLAPFMAAVGSKDPQTDTYPPICTFQPKDPVNAATTIGVQNTAAPTQELVYESLANFPWRQKIDAIASYPAANASTSGNSTGGECETLAAVNAKQALYIQFSDTNTSDQNYAKPCTVSDELMAELIQNIQAGVS